MRQKKSSTICLQPTGVRASYEASFKHDYIILWYMSHARLWFERERYHGS